jgi:FixJ family two-component response regulator
MQRSDAAVTDTVFVVDDDVAVRTALDSLLRSTGLRVEGFGSAAEFLAYPRNPMMAAPGSAACLILDVRLPGLSGLELQHALQRMQDRLPVIMISGHGDIPMSVRAMKHGAQDFLTKPFAEEDLLLAVREALQKDRQRRHTADALTQLRHAYGSLTAREQEVLALVLQGRLNKQIAADLNLSLETVKVHRRHLMQKMGLRSVAALVRSMEQLERSERLETAVYTKV